MRFTVASSPDAPHLARQRLATALGTGETADTVLLATSELVSNAVLHGEMNEGELILVEMSRGARLRVEVSHPGPPLKGPPGRADRTRPGGHGFLILDRLAARWAVEHRHGRTHAWFEL